MPRAEYIFDVWAGVKKKLAGRPLFLFFDYDGTLAPIVSKPDSAAMSQSARMLLKKLSVNPRCRIAVISGRSVRDVSKRVGIKGIVYAGNHGLEIKRADGRVITHVPLRYLLRVGSIKKALNTVVMKFKGAILEDKGCSVSVHYRMVVRDASKKLWSEIHRALMQDERKGAIIVRKGKMVLEILPKVSWDKGRIVLSILTGFKNALPLYVGDDVTDEDAFEAIDKKGIGILVGGPKRTKARYRLKDANEVEELMRRILNLCEKG